jgi:2-polyprenyl-3-methyl-5-hydroxy-6-metoxy-1,4-benzoquinol methylase
MDRSGQVDKARLEHWDDVWKDAEMPPRLAADSASLSDYPARTFGGFFNDVFTRWPPPRAAALIELGCARSVWLPYFAASFGVDVSGLDYSEAGCNQARALLARDGIAGDIRHGDIFSPPGDMLGRYDVVASFGLVEHFSDTVDCLRHCANFAKPGGMMITMIPNMFGVTGLLTRLINRPVYDMHVPLDLNHLRAAHAQAGLKVLAARYLMPINLNVAYPSPRLSYFVKKAINGLFFVTSRIIWMIDQWAVSVPATPMFSPYLACVARNPG